MAKLLKGLLREYNLQVKERNPFIAKMVTAFFLLSFGDVTCQVLER